MTSPAANPPVPNSTFGPILDQAMRNLAEYRQTAAHALDLGVDPREIIDYARGRQPAGIVTYLTQCPWVMDRVVALVKAARKPGSLGAKILAGVGPTIPSHWGIRDTGNEDADLATLLDQVR
ncbi:MAG: hypothetical protein ACYSWU_22470 [Planctomycetota bacterium]|jgi:hypothetical protein